MDGDTKLGKKRGKRPNKSNKLKRSLAYGLEKFWSKKGILQ